MSFKFIKYLQEDYEGPSCTECKKGLFQYNLEKEDGSGCTPCFCMGITQQCNSNSKLKRVQVNKLTTFHYSMTYNKGCL